MCTINKSPHTKKKSGNLFNDPHIPLVKERLGLLFNMESNQPNII